MFNTFFFKIVENLDTDAGPDEVNPHVVRVGWSTDSNNLLLGKAICAHSIRGRAMKTDPRYIYWLILIVLKMQFKSKLVSSMTLNIFCVS